MSSREKLKSVLKDIKGEIEFRRICGQNSNMSMQKNGKRSNGLHKPILTKGIAPVLKTRRK